MPKKRLDDDLLASFTRCRGEEFLEGHAAARSRGDSRARSERARGEGVQPSRRARVAATRCRGRQAHLVLFWRRRRPKAEVRTLIERTGHFPVDLGSLDGGGPSQSTSARSTAVARWPRCRTARSRSTASSRSDPTIQPVGDPVREHRIFSFRRRRDRDSCRRDSCRRSGRTSRESSEFPRRRLGSRVAHTTEQQVGARRSTTKESP